MFSDNVLKKDKDKYIQKYEISHKTCVVCTTYCDLHYAVSVQICVNAGANFVTI